MNEPNTIIVWSPVGWAESEILTRSSRKGHQSIIEIVDSRLSTTKAHVSRLRQNVIAAYLIGACRHL